MTERQRILLVDDDHDMLRLINHTLKLEGFDTVVVANADSALHIMGRIKPDLVIVDEMTPEDDNLHIIDHIREQSDVPIIMLTQEYEMKALHRALSHGADDFIRKPFGTKSFIARVRAKLRRAGQKPVKV